MRVRISCHQGEEAKSICTHLSMLGYSEAKNSINYGSVEYRIQSCYLTHDCGRKMCPYSATSVWAEFTVGKNTNLTMLMAPFGSVICIIVVPTYECLVGINVLYPWASCSIGSKILFYSGSFTCIEVLVGYINGYPTYLPTMCWVVQHNQCRMPGGEIKTNTLKT